MSIGEIVVGIDFGTRYSGVSWAINNGPREIHLINNWDDIYSTQEKVPTVIHYEDGSPHCWGYKAVAEERLGIQVLRLFNLYIGPGQVDKMPPGYVNGKFQGINKSAQEVAADYLRLLWNYAREEIRKQTGRENWWGIYALKVVLTVSAASSHIGQDRTRRAAQAAGLPENLTLITEPEAATLPVLKEKAAGNSLQVSSPQKFL